MLVLPSRGPRPFLGRLLPVNAWWMVQSSGGPQRPGAEKTSGEEAKDTAVLPGCLQPSHTAPSPSARGAEPGRQGFLPAGVLRSGMGTEDHPWEVIALRALPDPSLQLCPLCPPKGLSILNLTCPGPAHPSATPNPKNAFPVPYRAYVSCANWQKARQRPTYPPP